jgi:SAM-dependent methyltransferase
VEYSGRELEAMERARNYYRWILREFRPYLGKHVVEVGAGIGTVSTFLLREAIEQLTLLEPARNLFPLLHRRFADQRRVRLVRGSLEDAAAELRLRPADSVLLVNVLEHLPDDGDALRLAFSVLRPGGYLLLFVPALPQLYGSLDQAFGHVRRYTRAELARKVRGAGFSIVTLKYWNLVGALMWILLAKVLGRRSIGRISVVLYDRLVVPWLFPLEHRAEPPLGQSLLGICRRL